MFESIKSVGQRTMRGYEHTPMFTHTMKRVCSAWQVMDGQMQAGERQRGIQRKRKAGKMEATGMVEEPVWWARDGKRGWAAVVGLERVVGVSREWMSRPGSRTPCGRCVVLDMDGQMQAGGGQRGE